jgi:hypothetical protein
MYRAIIVCEPITMSAIVEALAQLNYDTQVFTDCVWQYLCYQSPRRISLIQNNVYRYIITTSKSVIYNYCVIGVIKYSLPVLLICTKIDSESRPLLIDDGSNIDHQEVMRLSKRLKCSLRYAT